MPTQRSLIPTQYIEKRILLIRGQKVILDADLAELYGVTTKRLNEQVKRNSSRFPDDFIFSLTPAEKSEVVANCDHLARLKFSRTNPQAFTEHGAIMAASVLNSSKAVGMSILIVRTFVKLRQLLNAHSELRDKLLELETRIDSHDRSIQTLLDAIRQLMEPSNPREKLPIGFSPWPEEEKIVT